MAVFINLEDSPMFQKQVCSLEEIADELKDRCQNLLKGVKNFMGALGEASTGDSAFADSLEKFGAGHDDPVSVSIGGPVLSKFLNTLRELASYKEFLSSQVEHMLLERLATFMTDLQGATESRRCFDKATHSYDLAREKFVSLKKNTQGDIVAELEEDLENSKSAFETSRDLINSLMNIEAKKKYEFLESISAIMDAHLRYFKLGYDLFNQLEPFIHQILTYAQQSKEQAKVEQDRLARSIQEFRTQSELDSQRFSSNTESTSADGNCVVGTIPYKNIEATLQSTSDKEVIKQGYLLKRSSSLRGDWKRRFFVLDRHGSLYYYRNTINRSTGSQYQYSGSSELNSSVFSRFRSRSNRSTSLTDISLGYTTIDLRTSMVKLDAEDMDLRLCFRIISPQKTYTLQAENGADMMKWVNKITTTIATLLNSHFLQQSPIRYLDKTFSGSGPADKFLYLDNKQDNDERLNMVDDVPTILREIPGNNVCAECNALEPDWASLNLGVLLCIECSGVHRNLGVHISKVRSLTLDVKVWEPTILELFRNLGNGFCNSVWEGLLRLDNISDDKSTVTHLSISKPCPEDSSSLKEKYIQGKYLEKALVIKDAEEANCSTAKRIWEAVQSQNIQEIYRLIVIADVNIVNTKFDDVIDVDAYHHVENSPAEKKGHDPSVCRRITDSKEPGNCLQGCTLLHVACHSGDAVMLELLLQFGSDVNVRDFHGRTPLHHCIASGNNTFAKILLRRGARSSIEDEGGQSVLERAMEMGAITDEELLVLLAEC